MSECIVKYDLDQLPLTPFGSMTEAIVEQEFGPVPWFGGSQYLSVIDTGCGKAIRRLSTNDGATANPAADSQFRASIPTQTGWGHEVWFSQWMMFESGYSFGNVFHTGKMNGIGALNFPGGGDTRTGSNGYSVRFTWRDPDRLELYVYDVTSDNGPGTNYGWEFVTNQVLPVGEWFCLTMKVKMNSSASVKDGSVRAWFNCNEVTIPNTTKTNTAGEVGDPNALQFYTGITPVTDLFVYSNLHGGQGQDWAPQNDSYSQFKDFYLYKNTDKPSCCMRVQDGAQALLDAACAACGTTTLAKGDLVCQGLLSCSNITTSGNISVSVNSQFGLDVVSGSGSNSITINDDCNC